MIVTGISTTGNYELEFRSAVGSTWYPSGHQARPLQEAVDLATKYNREDRAMVYRVVPSNVGRVAK
jgi:hypothetical protein